MKSPVLKVPFSTIVATVDALRAASTTERVLLWLAERRPDGALVCEVFVPKQYAEADYFQIPRSGMEELLQRLRDRRWMVAAQVHTHPEEAFHSWADDRWAIVRHAGALSLVVPRFCQGTTASTFIGDALVFEMTSDNEFVRREPGAAYEIIP
jgi:predicted TIM-barrel fold metal-dependent hydrolase